MDLMGYGAGQPRKPLRGLPADRIRAIRAALGDLVALEARS
jgi:4-hydroxy-tetrahydrodipicolinate synthase